MGVELAVKYTRQSSIAFWLEFVYPRLSSGPFSLVDRAGLRHAANVVEEVDLLLNDDLMHVRVT